MKTLKLFLLSAVALVAIASCKDGYDEAYYAEKATVTSSDAAFTASETGGSVIFTAEAGEVIFSVSCEVGWTATVEGDWLTASVSTTSGTLILAAAENTGDERTATVTLSTTESGIEIATIYATQEAAEPEPEPEPEYDEQYYADNATISSEDSSFTLTDEGGSVLFDAYGGEIVINVDCGTDWIAQCDDVSTWLNTEYTDETVTLAAGLNSEEIRTATVTIATAESGIVFATVTVTQTELEASEKAMILVYTTTSTNTEVSVQLAGEIDCTIDWGDGSEVEAVTAAPSHTYATAGEYKVSISGTVTALKNYADDGLDMLRSNTTLTAVEQWGNTGLTSLDYAFYNCLNLASIPPDVTGSFAQVTTFEGAFYIDYISLTTFEEIDENTSLLALPEGLFAYASKCENFGYTFFKCVSLAEIPGDLFDNCTSATNFDRCFYGCNGLTEIPEGLFDDCTSATDFAACFSHSDNLAKVPKGLFDNCAEVSDFNALFSFDYALTTIPDGLFDKCAKVNDFNSAFAGCPLTAIPSGLFDNCVEVTKFNSVFSGNTEIKEIPQGLFDNCTKVTTFSTAFKGCTGLTDIPAGLFDSCPEVTNFNSVFQGCSALKSIPENIFHNNKKVSDFNYAFQSDTALTGESAYDLIEINGVQTRVHLYERLNDAYAEDYYPDVTKITCIYCYRECEGLDDYNSMPSSWK